MSDGNVQLVREFFELNLFRVLTNWQHEPARGVENDAQLFVENTTDPQSPPLDPVLRLGDAQLLARAAVSVRPWHADRFYPSLIEANPVLYRFAQPDALTLASDFFQDRPFSTLLVVSELPASSELHRRAVELLQAAGVDYILEFGVVLQELLLKVQENHSYPGSMTLQTLRLLKRYRMVKNHQLEFSFFEPAPAAAPRLDAVVADDYEEETQ